MTRGRVAAADSSTIRTERIEFRVTEDEKVALESTAASLGIDLGAWVRAIALNASRELDWDGRKGK